MNPRNQFSEALRIANFSSIDLSTHDQLTFDSAETAAIVRQIRRYADLPYVFVVDEDRTATAADVIAALGAIRSPCYPYALFAVSAAPLDISLAEVDVIRIDPSQTGSLPARIAAYSNDRLHFDHRRLQQGPAWPTVSDGETLRQGEQDPRIREVRARLKATGELRADAPMADVFDAELAEAVKRFQTHHALAADGAIGRKTLAAMNTSIAARVDQIRVNLERTRWALHALRGTYVVVDIAGYDVTFVRDDKVIWESRAQVGQPLRMTPVLRSSFTNIVLNPNWTVPPTVLDKDIIPAARRDPEVVYKKGLRILDRDHNEFDPYEIEWERYSGKNFPYLLRQDPGDGNSLGRIKFNFPNKHAVYMHDTPKKSWFDRSERAFSSGCIRVDKPLELAELLLDDPKRWSQAQVESAIDRGSTRTLMLRKPVPVLILYWTVDVDEQGQVRFKQDIYNNDRLVLDELRKRSGNYGSIRAARDGRPSAGQATSETTKEAHGV